MSAVMKNFDSKRFGLVLKTDLCEARSQYIAWGCALLATLLVAYTIAIIRHNYLFTVEGEVRMLAPIWLNTFAKIIQIIGVTSLVGVALWVPCSMTANYSTRCRRIAALSLPASVGERFASRLVVFWLAPILFSLLMFWLMPFSYEAIPDTTPFVSRWRANRLPINLTLCASAIVVLAGTLAHKRVMLKLILTLVGIVLFVSLIAVLFGDTVGSKPTELNWIDRFCNYIAAEQHRISIFQLTMSAVVTTICLLVSYFRYKRFTLKR